MIDRYIVYNNKIGVYDSSIILSKIITASNLKQIKHKNNINSIVSGGNGRKAITAFFDLPKNIQYKIIEVFGMPPKVVFSDDFNSIEKERLKDKIYCISLLKNIVEFLKEDNSRLEKEIEQLKKVKTK